MGKGASSFDSDSGEAEKKRKDATASDADDDEDQHGNANAGGDSNPNPDAAAKPPAQPTPKWAKVAMSPEERKLADLRAQVKAAEEAILKQKADKAKAK